VTVDIDLGAQLHRKVADRLSEQLRIVDGVGPLGADDERALTRSLIADELQRLAEEAYRQGQAPLDPATEAELAEAVFDRVHGLGRLQQYIDDPDLANIHVNGFDNVWLVYRDGTKARGDPAADSDRELIDMVATAARRWGRSEKRWDQVSWELHLQLPGGERLHAVLGLTGDNAFTIRGLSELSPRQDVEVEVTRPDGSTFVFTALCRIDTPNELDYYRHGGILHYVLRQLAAKH